MTIYHYQYHQISPIRLCHAKQRWWGRCQLPGNPSPSTRGCCLCPLPSSPSPMVGPAPGKSQALLHHASMVNDLHQRKYMLVPAPSILFRSYRSYVCTWHGPLHWAEVRKALPTARIAALCQVATRWYPWEFDTFPWTTEMSLLTAACFLWSSEPWDLEQTIFIDFLFFHVSVIRRTTTWHGWFLHKTLAARRIFPAHHYMNGI